MKRYNNLYQKIISKDNLRGAHLHARRHKRWYKEVQMVDAETDKYIDAIYETLKNKTYHTSEYDIFERDDGKKVREIYKLPYYPDRIVHWAIMLVMDGLYTVMGTG